MGLPFLTWFKGAGKIHIQGDKPCRYDKPYQQITKHPPKARDKVQAVKDYSGEKPGPRIPFEKKRIEDLSMATFQIIVSYSTKMRKDPSWQKHMGVPLGHPHSPRYPRPRRQRVS